MDIEDDTLRRIIENAGLENTVKILPSGLDTEVGEMGYTLSGGERKRVGLVRVFLKDAPVVVLDEPYSGVDTEARGKIKEVIKTLFEYKTVIVISHDEEDQGYDRVLSIDSGKISEYRL